MTTWHDDTVGTTKIIIPPSSNGGQHVEAVHIGHLLEQIEQAGRQVGPAKHGSLAYDVLSALVAGGVDRELIGCVLEEVG